MSITIPYGQTVLANILQFLSQPRFTPPCFIISIIARMLSGIWFGADAAFTNTETTSSVNSKPNFLAALSKVSCVIPFLSNSLDFHVQYKRLVLKYRTMAATV